MKVLFTLKSRNKKLGKIPVSTSPAQTCPTTCPMKESGCYASYGPISWHWKKVEEEGMEWGDFIKSVHELPEGQLWRHNQAGDLAGDGVDIDIPKLGVLIGANTGKKGFTYTHYRGEENFKTIKVANDCGFTINLSANSEHEVDELVALNVGPVVTVMPEDFSGSKITNGGNTITTCPAVDGTLENCKECGVCQVVNRKSVIAFPAHGVGKKYIKIMHEEEHRGKV